MYKIEKRLSGFLLTFSGSIQREEMNRWLEESKGQLASTVGSFGVIIDMRSLAPLSGETQEVMVEGQGMYRKKGMQRSAVILANAVVTQQFRRLALNSGIAQFERYIDASQHPDWSAAAIRWVRDGISPED
jgi:hypothetical protein